MHIYEVSQITEIIKTGFDKSTVFRNLCIRGEVFNLKFHSSGHVYFSLKDEYSTIKCAMFYSNAVKLTFKPENGDTVIAEGYISVYPRDGYYQLYCSALKHDGEGDLQFKLEQLKQKLSTEGIFDDSHKKPIPVFPSKIAVITSPTGAAVRDIIRIIKSRWQLSDIIVVPVAVQGENAETDISNAIRFVNEHKLSDLIIVGRGGGSAEDLWAFNSEVIVREIYKSDIPVISAVGHEPDTCLSDFAADIRASTPSNAAELAVPFLPQIESEILSCMRRLISSAERKYNSCALMLKPLCEAGVLTSPGRIIDIKRTDIQRDYERLCVLFEKSLSLKISNLNLAAAKLDVLSPLKQFERGYSIAEKNGKVINSINEINIKDNFSLFLKDGMAECSVTKTELGECYGSVDL